MNHHWQRRRVLENLLIATLFFLLLLLVSCKEAERGDDGRLKYAIPTTLRLKTNSPYMVAGNGGVLRLFTCVYSEDKIYPHDASKVQFYCNGKLMPADTFTTNQPGDYTFMASYENVVSEEMVVQVRSDTSYTLISIPVIFHIIDQPQITQDLIQQLIADANDRFRKTPGSIGENDHPSGVDTGIEFRLARYDTLGQPMEGVGMVRHTMGEETEYNKGTLSYLFGWNPSEYMNVFISGLQSTGGGTTTFAQDTFPGIFPLRYGDQKYSSTEGLDYRQWTHGVNVNAKNLNDQGYTLAHELGHEFGLNHTFDDVFVENDFCPDTFFYIYPDEYSLFYCDCQTCTNRPTREHTNVMDYVSQLNNLAFTFDQRERMRWVLDHSPWIKDLKHSPR